VLGEEGDLSDGVVGNGRGRRKAVVDIEGKVLGGLAVECLVADEWTYGDDADGEGRGEGQSICGAGGARQDLKCEKQNDESEAGSSDQDVTRLDVGVVGDVEEGHDEWPEEEDPARERKAEGFP
jgi:hypothetical protein